jgi:lipoprotein signal peptidase
VTRVSLLFIALSVATADLATKALIRERLAIGGIRIVVDGWFNIVQVRNPGAVFGLAAELVTSGCMNCHTPTQTRAVD